MLRRPPTTITLTPTDIAAYEAARTQRLIHAAAEAKRRQREQLRAPRQQNSTTTTSPSASRGKKAQGNARQRALRETHERIFGPGSTGTVEESEDEDDGDDGDVEIGGAGVQLNEPRRGTLRGGAAAMRPAAEMPSDTESNTESDTDDGDPDAVIDPPHMRAISHDETAAPHQQSAGASSSRETRVRHANSQLDGAAASSLPTVSRTASAASSTAAMPSRHARATSNAERGGEERRSTRQGAARQPRRQPT